MSKYKSIEDIYLERNSNMYSLSVFAHELDNTAYEDAIDKIFNELNGQLNSEIEDYLKFIEGKSNSNNFALDTHFMEEKLLALSEMKIVYLFKDFEINLKKLVGAAYDTDTKDFYNWEKLSSFLKNKKIDIKKINNYKEIIELRDVNNAIKHSKSLCNEKTKNIPEFKSKRYISHIELYKFYKRIYKAPHLFIDAISVSIYNDLYMFDDDRLETIAELFALRMEKEIAQKFIDKLKAKY